MKLPDYPLPEGLKWYVQEGITGVYSKEDRWWYGWVRLHENDKLRYLTVATEKKNPLKRIEHGKFPSIGAACKFLSAYLILGDTDE